MGHDVEALVPGVVPRVPIGAASVNYLPLECIVAALNAMSWAMEPQKRIVSVASSKLKHL